MYSEKDEIDILETFVPGRPIEVDIKALHKEIEETKSFVDKLKQKLDDGKLENQEALDQYEKVRDSLEIDPTEAIEHTQKKINTLNLIFSPKKEF